MVLATRQLFYIVVSMDETDLLNASANFSRKFEHVDDNNFSPLGAIIEEALGELGGVDGEVFGVDDIEERLRLIQVEFVKIKKMSPTKLITYCRYLP